MKNRLFAILLISLTVSIFCFLLCFLSDISARDKTKKQEVVEETSYFKITQYDSMYYYYIFNKNHDLVKKDGPFVKKPHIILTDDGFIKFTLQTGTGIGTQWGYYYDIDANKFSEIFQSIYDQNNQKVAYGDLRKVIVRDIFDRSKYYREISSFSKSLSEVAEPIVDVKFVNGGTSVEISYLTGVNYETMTEVLEL